MVYLAALASQVLSASWGVAGLEVLDIGGGPVVGLGKGGIVGWEWVRLWQVFVMEGVDNVCCNRDRWRLFNLVLANLERMSALMLLVLGMCSMRTRSKGD